jgi:hypothetical protein
MSTDPRAHLWSFDLGEGHEHVRISFGPDGIVADGVVVLRVPEKAPMRHRYIVSADPAWRTRSVMLDPFDARAPLFLEADGEGGWRDGRGRPIEALDGCIDVDIAACCFTNTLPIRRLRLQDGAREILRVAYVEIDSLAVHAVGQAYTRLSATSYKYEGLDTGFVADIEVDADGIVVRYPGLAHRV